MTSSGLYSLFRKCVHSSRRMNKMSQTLRHVWSLSTHQEGPLVPWAGSARASAVGRTHLAFQSKTPNSVRGRGPSVGAVVPNRLQLGPLPDTKSLTREKKRGGPATEARPPKRRLCGDRRQVPRPLSLQLSG